MAINIILFSVLLSGLIRFSMLDEWAESSYASNSSLCLPNPGNIKPESGFRILYFHQFSWVTNGLNFHFVVLTHHEPLKIRLRLPRLYIIKLLQPCQNKPPHHIMHQNLGRREMGPLYNDVTKDKQSLTHFVRHNFHMVVASAHSGHPSIHNGLNVTVPCGKVGN